MLAFDLAKILQRFIDERKTARMEFLDTRRSLERMVGSDYHEEAMKAAAEKREQAVRNAQSRARSEASAILTQMRKNAETMSADPPSAEQLAVLEVLKMRESISQSELDEAAAAMTGNGMCLFVIDDLARKNGLLPNYARTMSTRLSRSTVEGMINDLERGASKLLSDEIGAAPAAALYAKHREMLYGEKIDPDDLPEAQQFKDEFELLESLGIADFDIFTAAVG